MSTHSCCLVEKCVFTTLKDYNLCDILENHVNRKTALENPESDVVLSDDNRRKLVDIIVVFIVEVWA